MKKLIFIVLMFVCLSKVDASIIEVGAWINPDYSPELKNDQFILVDFWATWCGPCIKAMDHLAELKKTTGERVVYLSISNEPEELVKQFFSKKEAKTYVAIDFEGKTFERFAVTSLPYSILIAPDGSVIWKGQPSNLNFDLINKLTNTNRYKSKAISSKIKSYKIPKKIVAEDVSRKLQMQNINTKFIPSSDYLPFNKVSNCAQFTLSGSSKEIAAEILNTPVNNVLYKGDKEQYGYFSVDTCLSETNKMTILKMFLESFKIEYFAEQNLTEIYEVIIDAPDMLWNATIYEWNEDESPSFISSETSLQADNYSIQDVCRQLSNLLGKEIIYTGNHNELHDWNLNFDSIETLIFQLKDEYGLKITKGKKYLTTYSLIPKNRKL